MTKPTPAAPQAHSLPARFIALAARLAPIPTAITVACFLATALIMRFAEGRLWFCECGEIKVWSGNVWSSHCSQHLLDPYSLTHFCHGLILWACFLPIACRASHQARFAATLAIAAAWEILENSPLIIDRYRSATMSLDYLGDSVTNSMGDLLCAAAGYIAAQRLGLRNTTILLILIELLLIVWIRDNLTTNIIMLIHPIDALKTWQSAGHTPG